MTGRVRKRVTQACQPCGYKKIKCDGVYPECGPCRNKETCSYGTTKRKVNRTSMAGSPSSQATLSGSAASPEDRDKNGPTSAARITSKPTKFQQNTHRVPLALSVTAQMSSYLFQTYFDCIHPLWPVLYKPMYSSLDFTRPNPLLPPVLVSAMFSIAACVQERPHSLNFNADNETGANNGCPEPKLLFEEALVLLQDDDEGGAPHPLHALKPSITNCQVLVILAIQQHGVAEYSRGAMLCALAAAMAIELRLHRAHETADPIEIEVRSRLWWNLFIAEKMISGEMGRPVILRSEETDAPYPSISEADEFELMPARRNTHSINHRNVPVKLRTLSVLHTSIQLAVIMERISREIYSISARKAIREDQAAGEKIRMELWLLIRDWERDMEASPLKLDLNDNLSTVPGSITNYVILWSGTILLHRPFIERWQSNPASCYPTSAMSPFEICMQAASSICVVLEKYADCLAGLPCDTIFAIFTAASTLLYQLKQNPSDDETRRRLKLCIHWLSILGRSWKSAGARHQLLADLFDLPKELNSPTVSSADPLPPSEIAPAPSYQFSSTMIPLSPNMDFEQGTGFQTPMEDWAFLRDFGDSTDDFYALDVQLRGLLDGDIHFRGANNGFR